MTFKKKKRGGSYVVTWDSDASSSDMRIYTWLISMLVKFNYQYACSLSLVWVGYDIEGLVMLE